jgi:hypothetical protein
MGNSSSSVDDANELAVDDILTDSAQLRQQLVLRENEVDAAEIWILVWVQIWF